MTTKTRWRGTRKATKNETNAISAMTFRLTPRVTITFQPLSWRVAPYSVCSVYSVVYTFPVSPI